MVGKEDDPFLLGFVNFSGAFAVKLRGGGIFSSFYVNLPLSPPQGLPTLLVDPAPLEASDPWMPGEVEAIKFRYLKR